MNNSYIKKIISVKELENVTKDIQELYGQDNISFGHALNLKHDINLISKALSHESLLLWNTHVWSHFNGEKWDSIFIGIIRKSEKFNKKIMDEYLWVSKNSNTGMCLYRKAYEFAKSQKCEYIYLNITEGHPKANRIKEIYNLLGYVKDTEAYLKKID
jgi:hypothetical protein